MTEECFIKEKQILTRDILTLQESEIDQIKEQIYSTVVDTRTLNFLKEYLITVLPRLQQNLEDHEENQFNDIASLIEQVNNAIPKLQELIDGESIVDDQFIFSFLEPKCYLRVAQMKNYVQNIIDFLKTQTIEQIKSSDDFERSQILPGQQVFYRGAFGMESASHHFIYIYNDIIAEVGSTQIPDCKQRPMGTIDEIGRTNTGVFGLRANLYKSSMNYFGLGNMYNVKYHWLKKYKASAKGINIYEFPGDDDKKIMIERLERVVEEVGPWDYTLINLLGQTSNNCENAANYVSFGRCNIPLQSCVYQRGGKFLKEYVLETGLEDEGESYSFPTENEKQFYLSQLIPACGNDKYAPKIFSTNECPCIGNYKRNYLGQTWCNIDYDCALGKKITTQKNGEFYDDVKDFQIYKACKGDTGFHKGEEIIPDYSRRLITSGRTLEDRAKDRAKDRALSSMKDPENLSSKTLLPPPSELEEFGKRLNVLASTRGISQRSLRSDRTSETVLKRQAKKAAEFESKLKEYLSQPRTKLPQQLQTPQRSTTILPLQVPPLQESRTMMRFKSPSKIKKLPKRNIRKSPKKRLHRQSPRKLKKSPRKL